MTDHVVTVNGERKRFEIDLEGHTAFLQFDRDGDRIVLVHTDVPDALEGRGVGSAIVRGALGYARENGLSVVPRCPFVRSYVKRHPNEVEGIELVGW